MRKQVTKLFFGALAAAGENQHLKIEKLARGEIVAWLNYTVDHEKFTARIHAFSAGFEQLDAPFIRPVVDDVFHDVSIRTRRNRGKHIAAGKGTAFHHGLQRSALGTLDNVRHLIERAPQMWIPLEDGRQQKAVATANVHDGADALKIVCFGYGRTINHGQLSHCVIENLRLGGMLL